MKKRSKMFDTLSGLSKNHSIYITTNLHTEIETYYNLWT